MAKLGIHPDGMFGHSLGENGCAYADGCFNVYETLMAAYARGKVSEFLMPEKGLMAAVGKCDSITNVFIMAFETER